MRRPTQQEHQRILAQWMHEDSMTGSSAMGAVLLAVGIGLMVIGSLSVAAGIIETAGGVVVAIFGAGLLVAGLTAGKGAARHTARRMKLTQGAYCVVPAWAMMYSLARNNRGGSCRVRFSDGRENPIPLAVPKNEILRLYQQRIGSGPVMVIVIDGDDTYFASPW